MFNPAVSNAVERCLNDLRVIARNEDGLSEEEVESLQIKVVQQKDKRLGHTACTELQLLMAHYGQSEEGEIPELSVLWEDAKRI